MDLPVPDQPIGDKRVQGVHTLVQSFILPPLVVYSATNGLTLKEGIRQAVQQNLSFAEVQASPEFQTILQAAKPVVQFLLATYGDAAALQPGETLEGSARWMLEQVAGMNFTTSQGPVRGFDIYAAVVNAEGLPWFTRLIADAHAALGLRRA